MNQYSFKWFLKRLFWNNNSRDDLIACHCYIFLFCVALRCAVFVIHILIFTLCCCYEEHIDRVIILTCWNFSFLFFDFRISFRSKNLTHMNNNETSEEFIQKLNIAISKVERKLEYIQFDWKVIDQLKSNNN